MEIYNYINDINKYLFTSSILIIYMDGYNNYIIILPDLHVCC